MIHYTQNVRAQSMSDFLFDQPDWFKYAKPNFEKYLLPYLDVLSWFPSVLEIGTMEGRIPLWLLDKNDTVHIMSIENNPTDNLMNNYGIICNQDDCRWYIAFQDSMHRHLYCDIRESPFDFVYIDGGHSSSNVLSDAILAYTHLNTGGLIAFDDYKWPHKALDGTHPSTAIDAFINCYKTCIEVIEKNYQVWIRKIA